MAANILDILAERQVLGDEFQARRLFNCTHGHSSLVERLGFACQLDGHRGCVNCLQWNSDGSYLLSGSDDMSAILWDPYKRKQVVTMPTGHTGNIFSVKFVPFNGDSTILTGAEDRDVRLHDLHALETRRVWSCSGSRVKRLAVHPQSPHLVWSAAEDGCIRQIDLREAHMCGSDGSCRNVLIDLNQSCGGGPTSGPQFKCIDINPLRPEQMAVGALDAFVRVYDTRILSLRRMTKSVATHGDPSCLAHFSPGHISNPAIRQKKSSSALASTYVAYSADGQELLVNLSGEHVYLFDTNIFTEGIKYDFDKATNSVPTLRSHHYTTTYTPRVISHDCHVTLNSRSLASHVTLPQAEISEVDVDLDVLMLREDALRLTKAGQYTQAMDRLSEAILICPTWHVLYFMRATALYSRKWDGDYYAALRDLETSLTICPSYKKAQQRRLKCLLHLGLKEEAKALFGAYAKENSKDVEFCSKFQKELDKHLQDGASKNGFSVERNHLNQWEVARQHTAFDYKSRFCGHCNTHTDIKEANFIGERGNYIAAGSDDGNIFIWDKATARLVRVLHGDDSIVNCVQWHPSGAVLASSGIESVVRLWEPRHHGAQHVRLVTDRLKLDKISKENQHRMCHDPFEVMLMRMGFNIAVSHEAPPTDHDHQHDSDEEGGVRWIEDPGRCRQS